MTDPGFADRTYLEPLDLEGVAGVLERERPDALLPTMGGQTALNLAIALAEEGVLEDLSVELIGAPVDVDQARRGPRPVPRDGACGGPPGAARPNHRHVPGPGPETCLVAGNPRPAFTLGGHGGGIARTPEELERLLERGARRRARSARCSSRSRSLGWQEFELEVMRDARRQRRRRLLDREHRPDGRAHRRLVDRRAAADAARRASTSELRDAAIAVHPRGRRRDRRLERPVRASTARPASCA